jgi:hypothetical protein
MESDQSIERENAENNREMMRIGIAFAPHKQLKPPSENNGTQ